MQRNKMRGTYAVDEISEQYFARGGLETSGGEVCGSGSECVWLLVMLLRAFK